MINKIVKIKGGGRYRILDSIILYGNTSYLVISMDRGTISTILPNDIIDIMNNVDPEISSIELVIKNGL